MKIKVILCGDVHQCRHYLNQEAMHPKNEHKRYRISFEYLELANDDERIIFITTNNYLKIAGIIINNFEEKGTAYKNRDYYMVIDFLRASTIRNKTTEDRNDIVNI